ncbi:hypothetical protein Asp14428_40680 [Actinoplanes sp. NBRC 14428]|nr:hypothetical protein Asp14428_40680 [Actinoplanes sp. NBRC 14428]
MHLGDADLVGDLGLGEVAVEAQGEDFLFAFVEGGEGGAEGDASFGEFVFVVFAAEGVAEFGGAVGADGGGEAGGVVGAGAFEAFEDVFFGDAEVGGDVGDLGERPRVWVRVALASVMARRSSCRRRGTRTDQVRSRKWRLISPMMVGMA